MNEEVFEAVCSAAWHERREYDYRMVNGIEREEWEATVRAITKVLGLGGGAA